MPGIGTVKIIVDSDILACLIRGHVQTDKIHNIADHNFMIELRSFMTQTLPYDAELLEIKTIEREPGKMVMVWTHPSFPSEPLIPVYDVMEPTIPEDWDYIK